MHHATDWHFTYKAVATDQSPSPDIRPENGLQAKVERRHLPVPGRNVGFKAEAGFEKAIEAKRVPIRAKNSGSTEETDDR
jgi:hypothetical protein